MDFLTSLSQWLTGGETQYMRLYGCMRRDWLWIGITVGLDLAVAVGYVLIALHWWKNQRLLPDVPAKRALGSMRNIFIFCGLCGYIFIPIKMIWPAWRLYDAFMLVLVYYTWRYALNSGQLRVIYSEIGRSRSLAADLARSEKETQEKSFFLNAISHDLRTPLNGLLLQASLAEMSLNTAEPEVLRQSLAEIKLSAQSAGRLLDTLLSYAQLAAGDETHSISTFALAGTIEHVLNQQRARAVAKGLQLRSNIPGDLRIQTDLGKLERIVTNLVDNAIKYTHQGAVRVEVDTNGKGIEIHVSDTGVGIAPQHRERLFEEFYQVGNDARQNEKGFGLGLAIAKRLASQLHGEISCESAVGSGSRFTLLLPGVVVRERAAGPVEAAGAAVAAGSPAHSPG